MSEEDGGYVGVHWRGVAAILFVPAVAEVWPEGVEVSICL